jgi:predicted metalloprotease
MRAARLALAVLLATMCVGLGGCGSDHPVRDLKARAEQARERLKKRVQEVLDDLRQAVPKATPQTTAPASRGRTETTQVEGFLDDVLGSVDRYWTRTLTAAGRPEPRVGYAWIEPGDIRRTGCGVAADDSAAFYCPTDDTIYVAVVLAARLWRGIANDFPGERAGYGHAVGDFGLAYVVAHEYAHNIQQELGLYTQTPRLGAEPFELQADCMAGLWGNSVYREGKLKPGDVEEAMSTATAAGDFDYGNAQHHGTPDERRAAWLDGFQSGDPATCARYVPV